MKSWRYFLPRAVRSAYGRKRFEVNGKKAEPGLTVWLEVFMEGIDSWKASQTLELLFTRGRQRKLKVLFVHH